jgi:Phosphotransferase enzyme family
MSPTTATIERVQKLVASKPVDWRRISKGYTVAERWVVQLQDGTSIFVKHAMDELTAGWLRAEHRAYQTLKQDYVPELIGWNDASDPILVLEDLSAGFWPPPWSADHVGQVICLLEKLAATAFPQFPSLAAAQMDFRGWQDVAKDPAGFLRLGLVTADWLQSALPALIRAEAGAQLGGDALVHGDVRSDNICFHGGRTLLVDWNGAARGNPKFDLIAWLPSLHAEGGPAPWSFTLDEPELIAAVAGFFACRAWRPPHPQGPAIRQLQLAQLRAALPWAAMALGFDYG